MEGAQRLSGWLDAIRVDMVCTDQSTDHTHALFDEIDRHAMQFEAIMAAAVALQDEATVPTQQQPGLIDDVRTQSVASIARAA